MSDVKNVGVMDTVVISYDFVIPEALRLEEASLIDSLDQFIDAVGAKADQEEKFPFRWNEQSYTSEVGYSCQVWCDLDGRDFEAFTPEEHAELRAAREAFGTWAQAKLDELLREAFPEHFAAESPT